MLGERIKKLRKQQKLSQAMLGKMAGMTGQAVSQVESGSTKSVGSDKLFKLAAALKTTPEWLLTGRAELPQKIESNATYIAEQIAPWDSGTPLDNDEIEAPFFTDVELAAGNGSMLTHQNNGPKLRFSRATLRRQGVSPHAAVCVSITGNSMEPVLPDGCTVGIDTSATDIRDGKMYAIRHGDLIRIKLLYRIPGGGLRVRSFNRDEYPDEEYRLEQMADMVIIGRVFWSSALW